MRISRNVSRILMMTLLLFFVSRLCFPCTSILVIKGASADGSVIITYSCDGEFLPRLQLYPAADHGPGEKIEIMGFEGKHGETPQVAHTHRVVDLMNEFQVAIGKITFDGRLDLINPDGMICAHANMFRIGEYSLNDPENCLYSENVISLAVDKGFYNPKNGPFIFPWPTILPLRSRSDTPHPIAETKTLRLSFAGR